MLNTIPYVHGGGDVNLKQLSAFREVMVTGSVSQAARNLNRTQPAISSMIAGLENDIGFQLFLRRGGRLHPVPEAHYLLEESGEILGRLDAVERTVKSIRNLEHGVLRLAAMAGPSVFLLPELIARFVDGRDDVRVSLLTRTSVQIERLVAAQQVDVGLADVGFTGVSDSPLVNHDIQRFECLCAVPSHHRLAEQETVTAKDLDGDPMANLYVDHPADAHVRAAFEKQGATLNRRFEAQYFNPLLTFVERGLACAVVDPLTVASYRIYPRESQRIVFRAFRPEVELVASIMTPAYRPLSNLALGFIEELRTEIRRIRDGEWHPS